MRAEIARRSRRCLQATYGRSQLRERAVHIPEISIAPGIVRIRPWGRERRPGAGDVSRRGVRSRAGSKQGVCPAPMSSHTIPAHHPGHKHHSTGSPHPDTRGWGQTATPRAPASTQRRRATKPTAVATLAFIPSAYTSPAGVLARQRPGRAQTLSGTPGVVAETAHQRHFCKRSVPWRGCLMGCGLHHEGFPQAWPPC